MRTDDEAMMKRALELAAVPPYTSPNPRVGAVLARQGRVVAEAYHSGAGSAHAEALALASADAHGAHLYVTLEPCVHQGRTAPCAPAIAAAGVARVFVAMEDPDPRVSGRGIEALRAAGVEVEVGLLGAEAASINSAYVHQRRHGRPRVALKIAQTIDGRLAARDGSSRWITGPSARARVHARRLESDAVVVGVGTLLVDDPALTARDVPVAVAGRPTRVVLDSRGRVSVTARVFHDINAAPLVIATTDATGHEVQTSWKEAGAEVLVLPAGRDGRVDLTSLLSNFARRGWLEVYVEGGATLASALLRDNLVDRIELHVGPKIVGGGLSLGPLDIATMSDASKWALVSAQAVDGDLVAVYDRGVT